MTAARPWPNNARYLRDETAMQAVRGARALRPLVEGSRCTSEELLRRLALALDSLQTIHRLMLQAGAPVREA